MFISVFFLFLSLLLINTAMGVVAPALALYLTFDADEGDAIKDLSLHQNNGRIIGAPKLVDGIFGSALELNGASDSIEVPHDASLNVDQNLTLEMWVKFAPDAAAATANHVGIEKGAWEAGEYSLYANYTPGDGFAMQIMDLGACGDANSENLGPDMRDGEWHHIAGTWDGNTISLYADGELSLAFECGGSIATNKKSVFIGARTGSERFLKGAVDEVRIYTRTLSEAEIVKDMETLGGFAISASGKLAISWGQVKQSY